MVIGYSPFNSTCIGASHIKKGTICQDASVSGKNGNCSFAVVCDGHGGSDYFRSDRGSKFAVQAFCHCIDNKELFSALSEVTTERQRNAVIQQFIKSVITNWSILVDKDFSLFPFTEHEYIGVSEKAKNRYMNGEKIPSAYGTTLLAAIVTDSFWLGIHIGDGKCVVLDKDGEFFQPIPWDDKCFLNVTTSICDINSLSEFRFYYSNELPAAICLGSDGIDDCFAGDELLHSFYRVMLSSFADMDIDAAKQELSSYLPELSKQGSGDDMSIGVLFNVDMLKNIDLAVKKAPLSSDAEVTDNTELDDTAPDNSFTVDTTCKDGSAADAITTEATDSLPDKKDTPDTAVSTLNLGKVE